MESNQIKDFEEALNEVRKAHRLIYSFQERMLSLIKFIQNKLNLQNNGYYGNKHFGNFIPLNRRKNGLQINLDDQAWNYIYPYVFEYYIGDLDMKDNSYIELSIIQYADTGFFDSTAKHTTDLDQFAPTEKSGSKLLFFMEYVPPRCKGLWETYDYTNFYIMNKAYGCKEFKNEILLPKGEKKNKLLLYAFPLSRFINEKSTLEALQEYLDFLKENDIEINLY